MRWLISTIVVLVLLAAAWLANVHYGWLPRPTEEQRAALALLHEPNAALGERNAFAALWFLPYDVPEADYERLLREDLAAYERAVADPATAFESKAAINYAKLERPSYQEFLCPGWSAGCLDRVRKSRGKARANDARFTPFRNRVEALAKFDHVANRFPVGPQLALIPSEGVAEVVLVHTALRAADGDAAGALVEACRFGGTWRRLRGRSDTLIADMLGVAFSSSAAQLAGEILAAAPDVPWPEECATAFAPLADDEIAVCAQMRWEFRYFEAQLDTPSKGAGRLAQAATASTLPTLLAPRYVEACAARHGKSRRLPPHEPFSCTTRDGALAPFACILAKIANTEFNEYRDRVLDLDGRFATLRTAEWLRRKPDPAQAFADRPAHLRTPEHDVTIDVVAGTLTMQALETKPARATWTIPFARPDPEPAPAP